MIVGINLFWDGGSILIEHTLIKSLHKGEFEVLNFSFLILRMKWTNNAVSLFSSQINSQARVSQTMLWKDVIMQLHCFCMPLRGIMTCWIYCCTKLVKMPECGMWTGTDVDTVWNLYNSHKFHELHQYCVDLFFSFKKKELIGDWCVWVDGRPKCLLIWKP